MGVAGGRWFGVPYTMTGDVNGDVALSLTFAGTLMAGPNNTVVRAPGTTTVTGTATSGSGVYHVNLSI